MIAAVIQARMGSSRLPGKTLADVEGRPMLGRVLDRVRLARSVDEVVIATTDSVADDAIVAFAEAEGVPVWRGSEDDVLGRVLGAAEHVGADTVVRVTPDCPLLDPTVIDLVVEEYARGGCDYASNVLEYTFPEGCDVEVFSTTALRRSAGETSDTVDREHVTTHIRSCGAFALRNVVSASPVDPADHKWSVDTAEDLEFARAVYRRLGEHFRMGDVLREAADSHDLRALRSGSVVNEGYYRSIAASGPVPATELALGESASLKARAEHLIPDCTQTLSKGPSQFVQGVCPVFVEKAAGSRVTDVDGNEYLDYAMALGAVILGHAYPPVNEAVVSSLADGSSFTLPHRLEVELSERLAEVIPCAEMVRLGKNGSDATAGAVRLARAHTGRDRVACCGYHGWQDWYVGTTPRSAGVPGAVRELTSVFSYNDLGSLERLLAADPGGFACVIMEPVGVVEPEDGFLEAVRDLTHEHGALLVFDEIVTGFRLALGGAQEHFGVVPDLACVGKALGNGLPVSALVGRADVMRTVEDVFYSFTFGGETSAIAAAMATLDVMADGGVVRRLWEQGRRIRDGYNVLAAEAGVDEITACVGLPPRTVVTFTHPEHDEFLLKSLFQQECVRRGVLFTGGHNVSYSHSDEDVESTLRVYATALAILRDALDAGDVASRLGGPPVRPVFRRA